MVTVEDINNKRTIENNNSQVNHNNIENVEDEYYNKEEMIQLLSDGQGETQELS